MLSRFIAIMLLLCACNQDEGLTLCNTTNPTNNLPWLSDFIADVKTNPAYQGVTVSSMEYQGQTIFNIYQVVQSCVYCDLRDCTGQKYIPSDYMDFATTDKNEKKIWCQDPQLCLN